MTQNINPNSRAAFVDREGRLTKYGMDVVGNLNRAIGLIGGVSDIDDIKNQLSEIGLIYQLLAKNTELTARMDDLEAMPDQSMLIARIKSLESKIEDLEQQNQPIHPIYEILQRLNNIENQL